ncbi:MAG: T9SS type A sorting domain-containing protein [Candidatus Cloacimonetes bacterium]|nr:T9SS type A sorting domain-containing protein [Candidatus Cloacimonadota bacterium]
MRKMGFTLLALIMLTSLTALTISANEQALKVEVTGEQEGEIYLNYEAGSFEIQETEIDGDIWQKVYIEGESEVREQGFASLPVIHRSLIIADRSSVTVEVTASEYVEFEIAVAPSKGILSREINPEEVPYIFGDIYEQDKNWPEQRAELSEPYILRDYRGVNIRINPFCYNAVTGVLRFYTNMTIVVSETGISTTNVKERTTEGINRNFTDIYAKHFLNFELNRYDTIEEEAGRMLIISYGDFMDEMQPFVDWKNQKGIETTIVDVSTIGNNSTSIQNYIFSEYNAGDGLVWVLLVGDNAQVASELYSGAGGDPQYTYLEGGDYYSEIFIGRFSAVTGEQAATQAERSVYYERDITDGDWMQKGIGIASSQGNGQGHYGEADYVHMGYIRDDLLDYGYLLVDEIYDTNGGNATMVANALNEGRGIINYCGHGSNTSWSTTGFNNTYVNALTNDYMLPFIQSIACVNGNFTNTTCFAEAWLRATNGDAPTGAIAMFASSINQSWAPPMYAQDETIDLMCADELNTIGGLWFNGVSYMIDESNDTAMARTWHIFGDPSLQVRTMTPEAIEAIFSPTLMNMQESYTVDTGFAGAQVCLSLEGELISQAYSGIDGIATLFLGALPEEPTTLTLTITGYNKITEIEEVELVLDGGAFIQMLGYEILSGNDDILEAGEFASMGITLFNVGTEASEELVLELICDSEFVEISDGSEIRAGIPAGGNATLDNCFSFLLTDDMLNGVPLTFMITATAGEEIWNFTVGEFGVAEAGLTSLTEEVELSLDPETTGSSEFEIKNNNYTGEIDYTIFITDTTGERSIAGSTVTCDALSFTAGETVDWTFSCTNNSVDLEWIKDIVIDFPEGIIVNSATDFIGGSDELEFLGETGNGAAGNWHGETSSGWGYLQNGETATATVNVSIMTGFIGDVELNWELTGDDYGNAPHTVAGTINISSNGNPLTWISIEESSGTLTGGDTAIHALSFDTSGLAAGIFSADISVIGGNYSLVIPVTLYVGMNTIVYGDIDDNGYVESFDSSILLQYAVGLDPQGAPLPWEEWRILRADVDGNGSVEAYDAGLILQYVVGLITEFPAETGRISEVPVGDVDLRASIIDGENWLELFAQGEIFGVELMIRSTDIIPGEPAVIEGALFAWNNNNNIYRYAAASAEPLETGAAFMRIPIEGITGRCEVDVYIRINDREDRKTILLGDSYPAVPAKSLITGNYPNPFNPATTIEYTLAEAGEVEIAIYNLRGQKITQLFNGTQTEGYHKLAWNGCDEAGEIAASGTYICLMRTKGSTESHKLVLIK